jgi:cytochrome c
MDDTAQDKKAMGLPMLVIISLARRAAVPRRMAGNAIAASAGLAIALAASSTAIAAGNAQAGQTVFAARCAACHAPSPGQNKIGPSLAGIVGSKAGSVPGFNFSPAMKTADITWDDASLDKFLANPTGFIHGSHMFVSLPTGSDRDNVIAYLNTLKN